MPNNALHRRCVDFRFMSLGLYPHLGERERSSIEVALKNREQQDFAINNLGSTQAFAS